LLSTGFKRWRDSAGMSIFDRCCGTSLSGVADLGDEEISLSTGKSF
jgi:hypothetical protein